jgi:hypothetical protein
MNFAIILSILIVTKPVPDVKQVMLGTSLKTRVLFAAMESLKTAKFAIPRLISIVCGPVNALLAWYLIKPP